MKKLVKLIGLIKEGDYLPKLIDLTGKRFGEWTVVKFDVNSKKGEPHWLCKCSCGVEKSINGDNLKRGKSKSCGCIKGKLVSMAINKYNSKHNRLYNIWNNMKARCTNPNSTSFRFYGAKGILVCKEWYDFEPFMMWALSNGYEENLSLDRVNVYGNYEPQNCRWVTMKKQQNNKTTNRLITFKGETKTLAEWADSRNIKIATLWRRLKYGWTVEKSLTTPVYKLRKRAKRG